MPSSIQKEVYSEVLDILDHTRKEDVEKISPEFIDFLKANASKSYISKIDDTVDLNRMRLKPQTWALLALIYRKYWCSEEEREQFDERLEENTQKKMSHQIEMKQFTQMKEPMEKVEDKNLEIKDLEENKMEVIVPKGSLIGRIINTLKSLFHK